jgi:hypothetical protein
MSSKNVNLSELPNVVGIVKGSTSGFSADVGNVDFQEPQIQIQNLQEQNQDLKSRLDKAGL